MTLQASIILLIDSHAAIQANSLDGNIYMIDNMRHEGSQGEGTGQLVTAINGTYYLNGAQADELVLNWLAFSISSVPPTLQKSFLWDRAVKTYRERSQMLGRPSTLQNPRRSQRGLPLFTLDTRGELVEDETAVTGVNQFPPFITNIAGEAVEKGIIFPALYGSPDRNSSGLYWAASVSSYFPGKYRYDMSVRLTEVFANGEERFVDLSHSAHISVRTDPRVNGFTRGGLAELPLGSGSIGP